MNGQRVFPKIVAVIGLAAAAVYVAVHVNAWFFAGADAGSHVQQDFVQGGFSFTPAQRISGALIEGAPALAYIFALIVLLRVLWAPLADPTAAGRLLTKAGRLMLLGALLMAIYPIPASMIFTALEPGDAGMFLLSFQPVVVAALLGSLLFMAVAGRVRDYLSAA